MNKTDLPYRPCAGMMLLNRENKVFVGQRLDTTMEAWQMPQGGIDEGEDAKRAALRELLEEIGTDKVEIIARTPGWLFYDLPDDLIGKVWGGKYRGQKQKWYLMRFLGKDEDINLETHHPEFSSWKWSEVDDIPDMAVAFKRPLYRAVIEEFQKYL